VSVLDDALKSMDESLDPEAPPEETPKEPEPQAEAEPVAEAEPEPQAEAEPVAEAEPEPEPEAETPAETGPRVQSYLDKYGGDTQKALAAAVEAQELIGRQGGEVGELRKTVAELQQRFDEQQTQEHALQIDQRTVDWFDEQIEENPQGAAIYALQNDPSGQLYDRAMDAWFEMPGQARRAADFQQRLQAAQLKTEFSEMLDERTIPFEEQATKAALAETWSSGRQMFPDLNEHKDQIIEAAQENPVLAEGLVSSDPEAREKSLRGLYFIAKGMQTATVEDETRQATQTQQQENRAAKVDGTAATQTTAVQAEQVSEEEKWLRENFDPHAKKFYADEK
jgi:hypothetical protein